MPQQDSDLTRDRSAKNNVANDQGDPEPDAEFVVPAEFIEQIQRSGGDPKDPSQILRVVKNTMTINNSMLVTAEVFRELAGMDDASRRQLIVLYKEQQAHRIAMEKQETEAGIKVRIRSQIFAFCLAIAGLGAAATMVMINPTVPVATVASIIAMLSVGGPVTANILAHRFARHRT